MTARHAIATTLLLALLLAASPAGAEEFRYRWRLGKLVGNLAGIFLPNHGEGVLTFTEAGNDRLRSELLITSEASKQGEFWRYGSEMDLASGDTLRAWSSYFYRGKEKSRQGEVEQPDVVDVASAIYQLRRDPPEKPRTLEIWSDGKIYPIVVIPMGDETRTVDGRKVLTRRLSLRGVKHKDKGHWKGRMEIWLAKDEAATPVEIVIERSMAALRLELDRS